MLVFNRHFLNLYRSLFWGCFYGAFVCCPAVSMAQKRTSERLLPQTRPTVVSAFAVEQVLLTDSWIRERETVNTKYVMSIDADRLLHNFRVNAHLPSNAQPLDGWEAPWIGLRGHFVGHYLSTLSLLVERYHDKAMTDKLNYLINELEKCQQALGNGYLSAFPESDFEGLEKGVGGIWAPYYTYQKIMQGLIDASVRTGNKKALEIVKAMADYANNRMSRLDEAQIERLLYTRAANPGNEAGAMTETLCNLYRFTGRSQDLELARMFERDWFVTPLIEHRDVLSGLHSNTHLVLVNGLARYYELTGDTLYKNASINFWDMLQCGHCYANGSSSGPRPNVTSPTSLTAEHWTTPGVLSNTMTRQIAESCVSHNTQKLTSSLFTWTASSKYSVAYMNTFYNAVLALQNSHDGRCVYHLPLGSPRNKVFLNENDFRCCNGSSIEAFASLTNGIYYHDDSNIWLNLYVPSQLTWAARQTSVEIQGNFPSEPAVDILVATKNKQPFDLHFLIPSATKSVTLYINGNKEICPSFTDGYLTLSRRWNKSDHIRLEFDFDFAVKTMPDDKHVIALFHGPTMLAFLTDDELIFDADKDEILRGLHQDSADNFTLTLSDRTMRLVPLYQITEQSYGVYVTLTK